MKRTIKRTKKGKFAPGTGGGPGRGKSKQPIESDAPLPIAIQQAFFKAFMAIFNKSGNVKELISFCEKNQLNSRLLIQEVRRLLPEFTYQESKEFKSLVVQVQQLPETDAFKLLERDLKQLRDDNREMSLELSRMRSIFSSHNITYEEIQHEPVRDKELPGHDEETDEEKEEREYIDRSDRRKD